MPPTSLPRPTLTPAAFSAHLDRLMADAQAAAMVWDDPSDWYFSEHLDLSQIDPEDSRHISNMSPHLTDALLSVVAAAARVPALTDTVNHSGKERHICAYCGWIDDHNDGCVLVELRGAMAALDAVME